MTNSRYHTQQDKVDRIAEDSITQLRTACNLKLKDFLFNIIRPRLIKGKQIQVVTLDKGLVYERERPLIRSWMNEADILGTQNRLWSTLM